MFPKNQPIPPQTSPDLEQGKAEKEQLSNSPFLQGFPSILLALLSPPHAALPGLFPFLFPLLFSQFTGLPPPPSAPPLVFSPSSSLAYSLQYLSLPGVSRDDTDCALVPSPQRKKKASTPWKLARRQYSGRATWLYLSLHAA